MKPHRFAVACATILVSIAASPPTEAQDLPQRKEWRRADLSGAPGMEVVVSFSDYKPGEGIPVHFHHGLEVAYVIDGATVQPPGRPAMELKAGASVMALRDDPHGGFTVVGDRTLRLFTVHVVDKGKPLYDESRK